MMKPMLPLLLSLLALLGAGAEAQQVDMTRGGPMEITAAEALEWHQNEQQVVARGNARAVRGNVTVTADRLVAHYRKKPSAEGAASAPAKSGLLGGMGGGSNEIFRVEAIGRVHIYTATDQVWGERAIYDMDQAVLLMTGGNLRLTTPTQELTARDSLEYWTQKRMAVARGRAVVVTSDSKRLAADTLVAYTTADGAAGQRDAGRPGSGKLQRVEAFGNISIQTPAEVVSGDRGVYVADRGIARLGGNVRITRGQNQLNGAEAEVDMNTGISRLLAGSTGRVAGMVVPNDPANKDAAPSPAPAERRAPQAGHTR